MLFQSFNKRSLLNKLLIHSMTEKYYLMLLYDAFFVNSYLYRFYSFTETRKQYYQNLNSTGFILQWRQNFMFLYRKGFFLSQKPESGNHKSLTSAGFFMHLCYFFILLYFFFYLSNTFISNTRLKLAKMAKPRKHLPSEFLLFENYSLSSSKFLLYCQCLLRKR